MARTLGLAEHTLFAELLERSMDAMFDEQFPENGTFVERTATRENGATRRYWYYQGYRPAAAEGEPKRFSRYAGAADDPVVADRVRRFREIKAARAERSSLVGALAGAGMPRPPVMIGRVVEALAKAGVFRLRAVLVGTAAYQAYAGIIGARPAQSAATTGDIDVAQFRSISIGVEDSVPDMVEVLRAVDPSFGPVPSLTPRAPPSAFVNTAGFRVDFLTAHRGSDDQMGRPLPMPALGGIAAVPALGGIAAVPLRFMDFVLREPVRSVVLHGPGIPVIVPSPERFAVHKLIVSGRRADDAIGRAKSRKDVLQAGEIIHALALADRAEALEPTFLEAWDRGPEWRRLLRGGFARLQAVPRKALAALDLPVGREETP